MTPSRRALTRARQPRTSRLAALLPSMLLLALLGTSGGALDADVGGLASGPVMDLIVTAG